MVAWPNLHIGPGVAHGVVWNPSKYSVIIHEWYEVRSYRTSQWVFSRYNVYQHNVNLPQVLKFDYYQSVSCKQGRTGFNKY